MQGKIQQLPAASVIEKEGLAPGTQVGSGVVYVSFKKNWMGANEHTVKFDNGLSTILKGWAPVEAMLATDEASLLAAARAEGKVLVAPGTVIPLTMPLWIEEKPDEFAKENSWFKKENYHCERRPSSGRRAAVGAGAEGRVWAVGAQAWSAPR